MRRGDFLNLPTVLISIPIYSYWNYGDRAVQHCHRNSLVERTLAIRVRIVDEASRVT
jgi:hypothetical protein